MPDEPTISDDILTNQPQVDGQEAVKAEEERRAAEAAEWATWTDRFGRAFDPARHVHDPITGKPDRTQNGNLRIKPRTSKPSTSPKPGDSTGRAVSRPELPDSRELATVTVETVTGLCSMFLGDHWKVEDTEEHPEKSTMIQAWETYFRSKGITAIKPEVWVALVMAGYVAPRAADKRTREKVADAVRGKPGKIRAWIRKRRDARDDHRTDGDGENDARDAVGDGLQTKESDLPRSGPVY